MSRQLELTMVSKEKDIPAQVGEVTKKSRRSRRRRRRAGSRAAKRRARKANVTLTISASATDNIISPMKCAVHAFLLRYQSALRKVPAHIPPRVYAGPPSKRVKRVSWRKWRHHFVFFFLWICYEWQVSDGTIRPLFSIGNSRQAPRSLRSMRSLSSSSYLLFCLLIK